MDVNLAAVARDRVGDSMNTWPDHNRCHRTTLLGDFLFDHHCLRCHLEAEATKVAASRIVGAATPAKVVEVVADLKCGWCSGTGHYQGKDSNDVGPCPFCPQGSRRD